MYEIPSEPSESDDEIYAIEQIGAVKHNHKGQSFKPMSFNHDLGNTTIDCQLDTGATCNVMSMTDLCKIQHTTTPPQQSGTSQLRCYDNSVINTLGQCTPLCSYRSNIIHCCSRSWMEIRSQYLSSNTCMDLDLVTVHTVCNVHNR